MQLDQGITPSSSRNRAGARFCLCILLISLSVLLGIATVCSAKNAPPDLTTLSLEDLMEVEITSVSKRPQKLSDAAAAIFVITQDDIRRSGATNIPDALRMAPGVNVARISAHSWAISIRGFNDRFANKLLVLMDGRALYTELFSGVLWRRQDTVMGDIERIEVIRGPGASIWGANAVNGVINIITKKASDTQGFMLSAGAGSETKLMPAVRYGGVIQDMGHYRIYAKGKEIGKSVDPQGNDLPDDRRSLQGGFRLDLDLAGNNQLTVQGDFYNQRNANRLGYTNLTPPYIFSQDTEIEDTGANLLARWSKTNPGGDSWYLQGYYDYNNSQDDVIIEWSSQAVDLEFNHNLKIGERHKLAWGLGFRWFHTATDAFRVTSFDPQVNSNKHFSTFVQDEFAVVPEKLFFTLGSKFEYNDDTGFEVQPSARLLWKADKDNAIWAAASRAVRTPSRGELDGSNQVVQPQAFSPPILFELSGNPDLESEELIALEMGLHSALTGDLSIDFAVFYNIYDSLFRVTEPSGSPLFQPMPVPHLVLSTQADNQLKATSYGFEVAVNWDVLSNLRLIGTYSFLFIDMEDEGDEPILFGDTVPGRSPRHSFGLRAQLSLTESLDLDAWLRYVDELPDLEVPSYLTVDLRVAWRPVKGLEISLVGQNLLDNRHPEFVQTTFYESVPSEVERSVYLNITWRF
jgi:iron complex outermembrane receptor protein